MSWRRAYRAEIRHRFSMAFTEQQAKSAATRDGIRCVTWMDLDGGLHHYIKTSKWHEVDASRLMHVVQGEAA